MTQDMIVILDLGSNENVRIAREIRALGVYSEIYPHDIAPDELKRMEGVRGIIVNGGPNRVVDGRTIDVDERIYHHDACVLSVNHSSPAREMDLKDWPENTRGVLDDFLTRCGAKRGWSMDGYIADQVGLIRRQVGGEKVLLALSGGVDSSVVAALLLRAIGKQLVCVHVNHGLMRKGESEQVIEVFRRDMGDNLIYIDAEERFLRKLEGVDDPEQKRKIIGEEFIRVFEEEAAKISDIRFLAQGTIYPDILESGTKTVKGVKAHHNVGGLPGLMRFELVEPVRQLFKDEVRACGVALGLPESMVYRQPFPGPGLGVRCPGAITRDRLEIVRESDAILREEFRLAGLSDKVWQYFTVVPPFKSTGVRDHARTFEYAVVLRAVNTVDAMEATVEPLSWPFLQRVAGRILSEVAGCNRVLYDITPKPPATIEWE